MLNWRAIVVLRCCVELSLIVGPWWCRAGTRKDPGAGLPRPCSIPSAKEFCHCRARRGGLRSERGERKSEIS